MYKYILFAMILAGCSSAPKTPEPILAAHCEKTAVNVGDLAPYGFQTAPGKVVVTRLFRVNCPFCKDDLRKIGGFFHDGTWTKDNVQVFLIAYRKEGAEDRRSFDKFMREELHGFGIPPEATQVVYVDKDYYQLVKARNKSGDLVFEGWRAVPFGLVFAKDGRLAYRGHFTSSPEMEDTHYAFIKNLQTEVCAAP